MKTLLLPESGIEWLLRGSAVLSAVWLLSFLSRVPAALRHAWLVTGMFAALLMPVFMTALPSWSPGPLTRYVPAPSAPQQTSVIEVPAAEPASFARATSVPVPGVRAPLAPAIAVPPASAPVSQTPPILFLWIGGTALLTMRLLAAAFSWRRTVRSATPLQIISQMDVRLSSRAASPVSGGLFRSVVLLPSVSLDWPPRQMKAVLAHEAEHIRRRDAWWLLLGHLLCALQWFNPLTWLLHRRAATLREEACDAAALRRGVPAADYADALLALASPHGLTALASPMARRTGLERRIRMVLNSARLCHSVSRSASFAGFAIVCILALCASILRSEEKFLPLPPAGSVPESADDASLTRPVAFFDYSHEVSGEVILDPGGCLAPSSNIMEGVAAAQSLDFCFRVKNLLESQDVTVFLTRYNPNVCPQEERIKLIKQHPGAVLLSIQPGDYESKGYTGVAAVVVRRDPGLSRSIILAHHLLTKFAVPGDTRLPPIYYSNDPRLTASAPDTPALILHTGSDPRDETAWRSLVFSTVEACRDTLRKPASETGNPAQILTGTDGRVGKDVMRSDGGHGIAAVELDGRPCVIRWTADHLEYPIPAAGAGFKSMTLSGSAALQILGLDIEISRADRLSGSLQNYTLHVEGKFQVKSADRIIQGSHADSSLDISRTGTVNATSCSIKTTGP